MSEDFEQITTGLEKLETNLITVVNDLKASTEIILKELTGYLNVSAHDLSEIKSTITKIEMVLESLKGYINKLDLIEKEIASIKPSIAKTETKMLEVISNSFNLSNANIRKLANYIVSNQKQLTLTDNEMDKRLEKIEQQMRGVVSSFKATKEELIKSQEGLYSIINSLVINKSDVEKAQISLQGSKIKTAAEQQKQKLWFIAKIIGIFFGSGGILFFAIKTIIETL